MKLLIRLMLVIMLPGTALGQMKTVQVVTKLVENSFPYNEKDELILKADKANIMIQGWDKASVKVELRLITKAMDKKMAIEELKYLEHAIEKKLNKIFLGNYFVKPHSGEELKSIGSAKYNVWVPNNVKISLTNSYGNTLIKAVSGNVQIDHKYGEVELDNVAGKCTVNAYLGDLFVNNFSGVLSAGLDHVELKGDMLTGRVEVNSTLGDVVLSDLSEGITVDLELSKCDGLLQFQDLSSHRFDVRSRYGEVVVPIPGATSKLVKNWRYGDASRPLIKAGVTFGNLTIVAK